MPRNLLQMAGRLAAGGMLAGTLGLSAGVTAAAAKRHPAPSRHTTAGAAANGTLDVTGAGLGHGIGMSQYGALGLAEHGWSAPAILGHYYQGTTLGQYGDPTITVLLNDGVASLRGIASVGQKKLDPTRTYEVEPAEGGKLKLLSGGRSTGPFPAPLRLSPPPGSATGFELIGHGHYSGSVVAYPNGSGGVLTVDAVDLEEYVRGVISEESPSSWPAAALEAQAIAARTYVLADPPVSPDYDVYSDTRSQMYGGISAETTATDAAEQATRGEVVESGGHIIPTYFSASSGGYTEDIQNVWVGVSAAPYLVGVSDPYDNAGSNPYYRWNDPIRLATAARRLRGLFQGTLEGIKVLRRGVSPRVVSAEVVGTKGSTTVSGETLQSHLRLDSTWMSFTTVTASGSTQPNAATPSAGSSQPGGATPSAPSSASGGGTGGTGTTGGSGFRTTTSSSTRTTASSTTTTSPTSTTGGAGVHSDLARVPARRLVGSVFPARPGARVLVELDTRSGWTAVGAASVDRDGRFALRVIAPGRYRAVYAGAAAPPVHIR